MNESDLLPDQYGVYDSIDNYGPEVSDPVIGPDLYKWLEYFHVNSTKSFSGFEDLIKKNRPVNLRAALVFRNQMMDKIKFTYAVFKEAPKFDNVKAWYAGRVKQVYNFLISSTFNSYLAEVDAKYNKDGKYKSLKIDSNLRKKIDNTYREAVRLGNYK
jgi:hypothetical protein